MRSKSMQSESTTGCITNGSGSSKGARALSSMISRSNATLPDAVDAGSDTCLMCGEAGAEPLVRLLEASTGSSRGDCAIHAKDEPTASRLGTCCLEVCGATAPRVLSGAARGLNSGDASSSKESLEVFLGDAKRGELIQAEL